MRFSLLLSVMLAGCTGAAEEAKYSQDTDPTITQDTEPADTDSGSDTDTDTDTDSDTDSGSDTDVTSLYDQLGGAAVIDAVVEAFVGHVGADSNINWMFANTDLADLKQELKNQICEATGGPCVYTGGDMTTVHASMAITDAQWTSLVNDLLLAFDDLGVTYTAGTFDGGLPADTLVLALAGMHDQIVTDADGSSVLFNQLGGHAAVDAVVSGLLANVGADDRINSFFAETDLVHLHDLLVEQVCEATGGYCHYSGRSMAETHAGLGICEPEFNALVEDLLTALDTLGVLYALDGSETIDPLLLALVGMESDILDKNCP